MGGALYFDADCGFCTRCAGWLAKRAHTIEVAPLQGVDLRALGIDSVRAAREVPFRHDDGRLVWGAAAIAAAARDCGPAAKCVGIAVDSAALRWPARAVYALVARHRHRLPGGTAACALPR